MTEPHAHPYASLDPDDSRDTVTAGAVDSYQTRHTVDTITSDALDQLYAERDMHGREADRLRKDWVTMRARAEQAEATIERMKRTNRMVNGCARDARLRAEQAATARVRAELDRWALNTVMPQTMRALDDIRAALDESKEPRP
ncbi:hypothetical protein ABZY44_13670 [Streptomyces sp. NPDC006544]|uniref:hypothetical protein n=1 Tax=Streptomyces sp. NPDC006544 TaxID=3154583 RepID=UPI0033AC0888